MSSGNVFERLFKLWASVCKLVLDGKRAAEEVCSVLQAVVDGRQLVEAQPTLHDMVSGWVNFYKEVFGLDLNFSEVQIPERKPGFDRLIIVAQGMTPQRLFNKCKELFTSWKYTDKDLDEFVKSVRTAENGTYAIWVRERVDADKENKNLSANQLKERGDEGITLEERMLYELKFFNESGKHLDVASWTLCAGSRYSDGDVPCVRLYGDKFKVYWSDSYYHSGSLRSRSVVS